MFQIKSYKRVEPLTRSILGDDTSSFSVGLREYAVKMAEMEIRKDYFADNGHNFIALKISSSP